MLERVDVAVIGAGPAGAAVAIGLRGYGRSVAIIDQTRTSPAIGETLPPEATPLLQQLGVWSDFVRADHLPAVCNESAWGSDTLDVRSFINTPYGRGWHLDRPAFDAMLRRRAHDAGTQHIEGRASEVASDDGWRLTVDSEGQRRTIAASWIVDATGRASWLAARLGVRRIQVGQLTASALMFCRSREEPMDPDRATLVETAPCGWFYTAVLPGSRRIAVCFTRPSESPRTVQQFLSETGDTSHVRRRLEGYEPVAGPWLFTANSSSLDRSSGPGWTAVGDAACAHDPLSSRGLLAALDTSIHAAAAIDAALKGSRAALTTFELRLRGDFEKYLQILEDVYAMERRWPERAFWRQ
jgi:2-polyprenyl-6-methoxyphenol hydroxylase-like FAD-dependent oxidoreductase